MSLDSIVRITISTQNLQMAQAGFGVPLIIAEHSYLKNTVTSFSSLAEVFALRDAEKEKVLPDEQKFHNQPLYLMSQALFAQKPCVPKIKIGKRNTHQSITEALAAISPSDVDGDFYGILLLTDTPEKDYPELAKAISDKRLLAGFDLQVNATIEDPLTDIKKIADMLNKSEGASRVFSFLKANADDYPAAALMGRMLAQSPGSSSWAFKELKGIEKAKLNTQTTDVLKNLNVNRHIDINKVGVTLDGKLANGEYIDIIHGIDWLHVRIQERLFRLLMINGKIPYTTKGIDLVRSEIIAQLKDAVDRGLLAADPEPEVSIPAIEAIDSSVRQQRKLPDVKFSGRLAGAIHEIEIQGTVSA
jgi:hypothetical protein